MKPWLSTKEYRDLALGESRNKEFIAGDILKFAPDPVAFEEYIDDLIDKGGLYCNDIDWTFLGFLENYYYLSKIIPKECVVVDVGCNAGIQHVLFKDFKGYVGIDTNFVGQKAFTPNARFIQGNFRDVAKEVKKIKGYLFGISNMALHPDTDLTAGRNALGAFKAVFHDMWIRYGVINDRFIP